MMRLVPFTLLLLVGCTGSSSIPPAAIAPTAEAPPRSVPASIERPPSPKNVVFGPANSARLPTLKPIELPKFHAAAAIWGSTGRDHRGHIYFGISTDGDEFLSAHLVEYDPQTGRTTDRGGAVENLKRLGLAKTGENQNKIHTKIWQANDGYLYFASLDEGGENEDGSKLPNFGSHLWRVKPGTNEWEHLAAVREAVIASAIGGGYVYFLGYFGHVLHQWDTERGKLTNSVRVGSVGGHTSRNIFADSRGHVFVPRVAGTTTTLIEFDENLHECGTFPLTGYGSAPDSTSHGIVAVTQLKDESFAFITDKGRLFRLMPRATGSAIVDFGNIHPDGECYCPTLFTDDGETRVFGLGHRPTMEEASYEWLTFDLRTRKTTHEKLRPPVGISTWKSLLIYGSVTRDDDGRFYLGGRYLRTTGETPSVPIAWQVTP